MRSGIACVASVILAGCVGGTIEGVEPPPNAEPLAGCAIACHGGETSNAPPKSLSGATETTAVSVGAHQTHLSAASWHKKVDCADCHAVPADVGSPGHMDGDNKVELTFSARAGDTMWNGTTCTSRCHGTAAWGGSHTTPTWTQVDGTQVTCGSCHGAPPPAPHPTDTNCATCHPTMEDNSLAFRDPDKHIDGVVDLVDAGATGGCTGVCHGTTGANAAPPKDLAGNTAATAKGVGAHQAHLTTSTWRRDIPCASCHTVPLTSDAPGHRDGDNLAEVKFDTLNPAGTYANTTCSNQYCHGNGRGNTGTIGWLAAGPLPCTGCHATNGTNMSGDHRRHIVEENMKCSECHQTVVDANMGIIAPQLHVNGVHEVKMANGTYSPATRQCSNTGCHNTKVW